MSIKTVKLGLMPPLTGLVGIYGSEIVHAGQIACQEINENGGVLGLPLELVIEDDGSLPESAVAAAEKLVNQHHCTAIIGNLLSNSRIAVAYRVAEPRKIPLLNFSFYEGSILSRYFFHFAALPNQQIEQMIPYMAKQFGKKMFFAGNNYEWPRGSIHAAKLTLDNIGGHVVGEEYCPIGVEPDAIESLLDRVEAANPDVFVPYFAGADQVHLLTRFTERGLKGRMAVVMGHYDEMMASQLSAEVREGFFSSNTYFMSVDSPENLDYLNRLSKLPDVDAIWPQGNGIVTNFGEGAYVCVKAFAKAANEAGSLDSEALVEALKNIEVLAPQGPVQMNPEHHHAKVNTFLSHCDASGRFNIVERFGMNEPMLPERYSHQRINHQATLEDDIRLQARILEQMSEAVLLINSHDGSIVYTNSGAERVFGYEKGEMIGLSMNQLGNISGDNVNETISEMTNILNQKGSWQGEASNAKKDGTAIWCSATLSTFTHPVYGEVWLGVYRDITEQKQAEISLAASDERFRLINSRLPGILYQFKVDFNGNRSLPYVSPTIEKYLGITAEVAMQDVGKWFALTHPDDLPDLETSIVKSMTNMTTWEWEGRFIRKGGEVVWMHGTSKPMRLEDGVLWDGVFVDITERIKVDLELSRHRDHLEELVREGNKELYEREQQLKDAQRMAHLGNYVWDLKSNVLNWSDTIFDLFDLDPDSVQPTPELFLEKIHPDDVEVVNEIMNKALSTAYPLNEERRVSLPVLDYRTIHKDGSMHWLRAEGAALLDEAGCPVSVYGTVQDVSSHKLAEQEITKTKMLAEKANAAKSEFLSRMSHELRTPMNAILGFGQLLKMDVDHLNQEQMANINEILGAGNHLLSLINEVLDLSRIESGKLEINFKDVDLKTVINECISLIQPLADSRHLSLIDNLTDTNYKVRADAMRIKQVFLNLFSNAVKYNREHGEITIKSQVISEQTLRIAVSDTGGGLSEDDLENLFVPFQRLNEASSVEGTGIGLVITKRLVELMGGRVGADSVLGKGSNFWIDLKLSNSHVV